MIRQTLILFLFLQTTRINTIKLRTSTISALETSDVMSVSGHRASLPCDLSPPPGAVVTTGDMYTVYLVLWYREDEGEPLYSYDAREHSWNMGTRWSDEFMFGDRAYFDLSGPAALVVEDIRPAEAGVYRCRVDFKSAPTRNTLVNVTLLEPPTSVTIMDFSGQELEGATAGPYSLDSILSLTCVSSGGNPSPQVTWWRENELVDSTYERTYSHVVQNSLKIGPLGARHLGATYTCISSNNNVSAPVSRKVSLDILFPPTDVSISSVGQPLVAGTTYVISCEAAGSRPDPVISWWLASELMKEDRRQIVEKVGELTKSTIYFTPTTKDHGKILACRAENPLMTDSGIDDNWSITVYFSPRVNLNFGVPLNAASIKEGQDIFFRCSVEANPQVYKIEWRHDNKTVDQNIEQGVLISGSSLVLQSVTRAQAGNYTCVASNLEGDAESNSLEIAIKYPPICSLTGMKSSVGANIGTNLSVVCLVDAHPPPTKYRWTFNNSRESFTLPDNRFTVSGLSSVLSHRVTSEMDFGLLSCSASNTEGETEAGCGVEIVPAQPPQPPAACVVLNQTTELLQVECQPGHDGGLDQVFVLEVVDGLSGLVLANVSTLSPQFTVTGLNPGREVRLVIFAENSSGRSGVVELEVFTTKVAQLQVESPVPLQFTPFLGILAGIVATLLILILTVIIVIKIKYKYVKTASSSGAGSPGSSTDGSGEGEKQQTTHYKSFKFDTDPDKKMVKSGDDCEFESECSSVLSEKIPGPGSGTESQDSYSGSELAELAPGSRRHRCDHVTSWTPFLARNCEESVI